MPPAKKRKVQVSLSRYPETGFKWYPLTNPDIEEETADLLNMSETTVFTYNAVAPSTELTFHYKLPNNSGGGASLVATVIVDPESPKE